MPVPPKMPPITQAEGERPDPQLGRNVAGENGFGFSKPGASGGATITSAGCKYLKIRVGEAGGAPASGPMNTKTVTPVTKVFRQSC
jgi:hypothetical protein